MLFPSHVVCDFFFFNTACCCFYLVSFEFNVILLGSYALAICQAAGNSKFSPNSGRKPHQLRVFDVCLTGKSIIKIISVLYQTNSPSLCIP